MTFIYYKHWIKAPDNINKCCFIDILKKILENELDKLGIRLKIVKENVGYQLRCAAPNAFDIEYTRNLGGGAVNFLLEGGTNAIITLQHGQIVPIPYHEMINPETGRTEVRMVNINSYSYQSAYKFMTRLKADHLHNIDCLEKLASLSIGTEA